MKPFQEHLLRKLTAIRHDIADTTDITAKKEKVDAALSDIYHSYDGIIAANFVELMSPHMATFDYNIDLLISALEKNLVQPFDLETTRRENEENFDAKYGSSTSAIITQMELPEEITPTRMMFAARCHPSPVGIVIQALSGLQEHGVNYTDWTFIDIGAGLGRNLLLASRHGFKRIIGVEISAYLCEQIAENIRKYNAVEPVPCHAEIHNQDILDFRLPDDNLVLYFWEPFGGEVQEKFIAALEAHVAATAHQVILVFLGRAFQGITGSSLFREAGRVPYATADGSEMPAIYFVRA